MSEKEVGEIIVETATKAVVSIAFFSLIGLIVGGPPGAVAAAKLGAIAIAGIDGDGDGDYSD